MYLSNTLLKSFQLSALATALALAGCGGGGHNDTVMPKISSTGSLINITNPNSGTTNPSSNIGNVKNIQLVSSNSQFMLATDTTISLAVYALDANNMGVADVPVTLQITDPNFTGIFSNTPKDLKTDASGKASIELAIQSLTAEQRTYLKEKGIEVKATVGTASASKALKGTDAQSTTPISYVVVKDVLLISDTQNIPLVVGSKINVTAIALDNNNNIIPNTKINFDIGSSVLSGVFANSNSSATTNEKGEAKLELEVKSLSEQQKNYLVQTGLIVKSASVSGVTSNTITLKGMRSGTGATVTDIAKVNLVTDKNTLTTNSGDTISITAHVRDTNNLGLANMPVTFNLLDQAGATGVDATTPLQATTNADGEATLTLKVGALTPAQKYYLQTSGLSFKATAGAVSSSTVTLKTQEAINANSVSNLLLTSDTAVSLALGSKVKATALAVDQNGAVIPNALVSFKVPTDSGLVNNTGAVITTDANGQAVVELEVKSLNDAQKTALQNGVAISAQSGVAMGTTTIRSVSSNLATQAYNVFVSKSKDNIRTGTDAVTLTVRVTDTNGGIKANIPIYLQILEDGIARGLSFNKVSNLKTDDKGLVTVNLLQNDIGLVSRLNGTGKVSVIVNDGVYREEKEEVTVPITGTTVDNLLLSNKEINNTTNSTISASALDGSGKPFANTKVELLLNDKSLSIPKSVTTDAQGKFTFTVDQAMLGGQASKYPLSVKLFGTNSQGVEISSSPISLTDLTSTSLTDTKLILVDQNGAKANNREILVNTTGQITILRPKDKAGNLLGDGTKVYLSTNKGILNNQGTRVEGTVQNNQVNFTINSSVANTANLVLEYNNEQVFTDSISFLTTNVKKILTQIERTTLSTNGETNVIATVKDSNDLPVKNAIVEFTLLQDASGGRLEKGYSITDDSGVATVKYYSGRTPTANDAVQIQTNVKSIQINGVQQSISQVTSEIKTLTVQTNATFIGFGFADKIRQHPDGRNIYYIYDGSIFVNNNIGQPAANQAVSVSIVPVQYLLGEYYVIPKVPGRAEVPGTAEVPDDPNTPENEYRPATAGIPAVPEIPAQWAVRHYDAFGITNLGAVMCFNEDINNNGIMDISEDANSNGKLDPINPATILAANGTEIVNGQTMTTDATGKLDFSIRYTKESADWWVGMIKVTTKVNGTEFIEYRTISLPAAEDDVSEPDALPPMRPNWISPFGLRTQFNGYIFKNINGNPQPYCY